MSTSKRDTRKRIGEYLRQGMSREEAFHRLQGGAFSDRNLATILAATPDSKLVDANKWKVGLMLVVSFLQVLLGFFVGWQIGAQLGEGSAVLCSLLMALIPSLMFWGFLRNSINAYNAYILVQMLQIPPQGKMLLDGGWETPAGWMGLAITFTLICYAFVLRRSLFPSMGIFSARSSKEGDYVFA
ncbi:hypothetical protein SDC9_168146 [bioreactor metagenome]|uniref:Permease n=1 Tax=bioreactor metagenome TaxID=1076179 RepID=A0A645G1Q7_9ZZZZ